MHVAATAASALLQPPPPHPSPATAAPLSTVTAAARHLGATAGDILHTSANNVDHHRIRYHLHSAPPHTGRRRSSHAQTFRDALCLRNHLAFPVRSTIFRKDSGNSFAACRNAASLTFMLQFEHSLQTGLFFFRISIMNSFGALTAISASNSACQKFLFGFAF